MISNPPRIVESLRRYAAQSPDKLAVTILPDRPGPVPTDIVSYGDLYDRAGRVAAKLLAACGHGDRVILLYPTGTDFVAAFVGCLIAGVIPVPAPLPMNQSGSQRARLRRLVHDCDAALVLTDDENLARIIEFLDGPDRHRARILSSESNAAAESARPGDPSSRTHDIALLQYTSGSTAHPRGVMVPFNALEANIDLITRSLALSDGLVGVSWLPLYHDMGLIGGLLTPLMAGGHAVLMSPVAFLRDPIRWLQAIDAYNAEASLAPNFAFDMCIRRISSEQAAGLDLSRWRVALNGAEPILATTIRKFEQHFGAAGFSSTAMCPAYGMAEVGLFVTGSAPNQPVHRHNVDPDALQRGLFTPADAPDARELISSGPADTGFDIRIVDPESRTEQPVGRVGEIWLAGPSVTRGYWGLAVETESTFRGYTSTGDGPFLRTGDLGVCHDGQLFVTGRLKEVIIIGGRNLYPQDLEQHLIELNIPEIVGSCAVFGLALDGTERLAAVVEIDRQLAGAAARALSRRVKAALSEAAGAPVVNVAFIAHGGIQRSTSGKVRRLRMRELFLSGRLGAIHEELEPAVRAHHRSASTPTAPTVIEG